MEAHRLFRRDGLKLLRRVYSEDLSVVEFKDPSGHEAQALTGGSSAHEKHGIKRWDGDDDFVTKTEITRFVQAYDENGFVAERLFQNAWGAPRSDDGGVFGLRYRRREDGQSTDEITLGADGEPLNTKSGELRELRHRYNEAGYLVEVSLHDRNGELVKGESGFAIETIEWDDWGNDKRQTYLDEARNPVLRMTGFSSFLADYNEEGFLSEQRYFGVDGEPVSLTTGDAHAARFFFDGDGNLIRRTQWDEDGKPALHRKGFHCSERKYDENHRMIEVAYTGVEGEPVTVAGGGFHRLTRAYDERGYLREDAYWGVNEEAVAGSYGWHRSVWEHDKRGLRRLERLFSPEGPTTGDTGVHEVRTRYDDRGNEIGQSFFDENGDPAFSTDLGCHEVRFEVDERGHPKEQALFGPEGKKIEPNGFHRMVWVGDRNGNIKELRFYGADGSRMNDENGIHETRMTWDYRGTQLTREFYDRDLRLTLNPVLSFARRVNLTDERGRIIETRYYGTDRKPTLDSRGRHLVKAVFGPQGKINEIAYFDVNDDPVDDLRDKVSRTTRRFNPAGLIVEEIFHGADGRRTVHREGFSRAEQDYNKRGQVSAVRFYDVDDKLVEINGEARREIDYDLQTGEMTEVRAYNAMGERVR